MSRKCQITGRGPKVGNRISHAHNVSKRVMNINIQKARVVIDGKVQRIKVSTKAIKSGLIERPSFVYKPRPKKVYEVSAMETAARAQATVDEEGKNLYFSGASVVDRIFEQKKKKQMDDDRRMTLEQAELEEFEYGGNFGKMLEEEAAREAAQLEAQQAAKAEASKAEGSKAKAAPASDWDDYDEDLGDIPEPPPKDPHAQEDI